MSLANYLDKGDEKRPLFSQGRLPLNQPKTNPKILFSKMLQSYSEADRQNVVLITIAGEKLLAQFHAIELFNSICLRL